jgi:hypothetical protein
LTKLGDLMDIANDLDHFVRAVAEILPGNSRCLRRLT